MQKQFPGAISALVAIATFAGAQTPGRSVVSGTTLETVRVSRDSGSGINIEITTKDETTPWVETLSDPARVVVELPNTVVATGFRPIPVRKNGVTDVRIGTDARKTTRVVVDLARLCRYELVPASGHRLILKLDPTSPVPVLAAKGGAPAESASPPSSKPPPSQSPANVVTAPATSTAQPAARALRANTRAQASTGGVSTQPSSTAAPWQSDIAQPGPASSPVLNANGAGAGATPGPRLQTASPAIAGAQTTGTGATSGTVLETVRVSREGGTGVNIEITTKDDITPWVQTLSNPARLVVGLPHTGVETGLGPIPVRNNGVKDVRIGIDAAKTTRVVVDLAKLCRYELVPGSGHRLILKLDPPAPLPALAAEAGPSATQGAPVRAPGNVITGSAHRAAGALAGVQASTEVVRTEPPATPPGQRNAALTAPASSPLVSLSNEGGAGRGAAAQLSRQPASPTSNAKAALVQSAVIAADDPAAPATASTSSDPGVSLRPAVVPAVSAQTPAQARMLATPGTVGQVATSSPGAQTADNFSPSTPANFRTTFNIKYVAEGAVYIEGGKDDGLAAGMVLHAERINTTGTPRTNAGTEIAELAVVSVSNTSAVCEIRSKTADLQRGDVAVLSEADQQKLAQAGTVGPTRKYPLVIAFSEGDPLDEEQREAVPKPPLPEVNRARGRIGFDYTLIHSSGTAPLDTSQIGGVIRIDMSRIGGSYWNLNGYWRGRSNAFTSSNQPQSVYDLVNRTYTLGFTYVNPNSPWVAGIGRLYLPWATSLDTFDGGYFGHRFGKRAIVGAFGGTAPDPTSFNYNPDRRTAGSFVAFEAGSFDGVRFTTTEGIAVSGIGWREDRQFLFNETGLYYKRFLSVYNATQADKQRNPAGGIEQGLARSFSTLRLQPVSFLSFDVNHNYFRDVPTFSAALVSTGLLDKFLFQGVSAGARVELPKRIAVYGDFGESSRSGDAHGSLNQLYGITLGELWFTGLRADLRYSKFTSSFGSGNYRAVTLSRSFKEMLRVEVNAGKQNFTSTLGVPNDYRLFGSTVDLNLGAHYFFESAINLQRGTGPGATGSLSPPPQNFSQWITTAGYRFDTGRGK